ncbi:MerR family transcriptional regulator [Aureibacillus halotolerans]|uniref:Chromosome-anchoring protein RacA n=1 Tax=Aureibacillus halotolerans TaxID=1508390 RepID=A0A4R6U4U5_9BACI|nr:MerR family transcriptional regulator [Aureibacillus halotolerans]TDQ41488.1 chromosome-anchoring protein RacA [Aureibacillus halotolerans]
MYPPLKTKEASDEIGVRPTTIRYWVKKYNVACERNDRGHLVFHKEALEKLSQIKESTNLSGDAKEVVSKEEFDQRMKAICTKMDAIEQTLMKKADEVVAFQLLQHRREMDELLERVERIEGKLEAMKNAKEHAILIKPTEQKKTGFFHRLGF